MKKKRKLLLGYGLFAALSLVAGTGLALTLLPRERAAPPGGLGLGVTDEWAATAPASAPRLRFARIELPFRHFPGVRTHRLPEDMGSGVALEDFNGDGLLDLLFANCGPRGSEPPAPELWINRGGCVFEQNRIPLPSLQGMGVAAADFDADGDMDVYLTGYGRNLLLRNDGAGNFTDVTEEAGVGGGGFSAGACWGDADGDGDLDLYACRYVRFDESVEASGSGRGSHTLPVTLNPSAYPAEPNLLYLNDGNSRFTEAARAMGVDNPGGRSLQAVFADFDGDGVLDLYVANDVSDNAMFRGRRGEPFEDATHRSCTADWRGAMGLAVGDPDRDGDLDIFITHWISEENTLYLKEEGDFFFRDAAMESYLGPPSRMLVGWACDFGDLDRDGRPDLVVVNGSTFEEPGSPQFLVPMPLQIFWNGGKRFFDLAPRAGEALARPIVGRGGALGDVDGDGDLDVVVVVHGGPALLLLNETETKGSHLVVEVRGSAPNPFGYGARVTVEAGGGREVQQVGAKVSYLSSGPHELHFGLGRAARAERVVVRFPSGAVVERRGVPAGQRLVVREVDSRALGPQLDEAGDALAAGEQQRAAALYREVLRLDPENGTALYNLAMLVEPEEGLALCLRLLRLEPMLPRGHLLRAAILSDPRRPAMLDLDAALQEIAFARKLNRDETGAVFDEGRILLFQGKLEMAARTLEQIAANPRAAALAALCRVRLGDLDAATRLLGHRPGTAPPDVLEEGDTARRRADERDLLARLLDLPDEGRWVMRRLPLPRMDGADAAFADANGDGRLDARVGGHAVLLPSMEVRTAPRVPSVQPAFQRPYRFEAAAAFALDPPAVCEGLPPGATAWCEADLDGDGDTDLVVACGGDDPCAALPWWALLREGAAYRPVRGAPVEPGFRVAAVAAADLDGDGRAEILLKGGGFLRGDTGESWLASLRR
ncbi:MAG: FG-GAP-like repeat-containing protein [Planctomycetaceae bacterium]